MALSLDGGRLDDSLFMIGRHSWTISCSSSLLNRLMMEPPERMVLTYSRKLSSLMSWSVNRKVVPLP